MPPAAPQPSMPPEPTAPVGRATLPLSDEELAAWQERLRLDREVRAKVMEWADANNDAYAPKADADPKAYGETLNTNRDFTLVERKKADLFYQRPDVLAIPSPL